MNAPAARPSAFAGAQTINSVSVDTPNGFRSFQLVQGDITTVPTDLLICSSHPDADRPPDGNIIRRLRDRHGWDLHDACRLLSLDHGCWTCFLAAPAGLPCGNVLVLRMPDPTHDSDGNALFDNSIQGTFAAVAALELMDRRFPVISLPLLYNRQLEDRVAGAETLIRRATAWLKQSAHTHTIQMVFIDTSDMACWNEAMDRSLGRSYVPGGSNAVVSGLCSEVLGQLAGSHDPRLAGATGPLRGALAHADKLSIEHLCAFGRKLVELMLAQLLPQFGLRHTSILANNIEELNKCHRVAPWIVSYMHTLRIFGNESVHARDQGSPHRPSRLGASDLVVALSAIRALLAFWSELHSDPES